LHSVAVMAKPNWQTSLARYASRHTGRVILCMHRGEQASLLHMNRAGMGLAVKVAAGNTPGGGGAGELHSE